MRADHRRNITSFDAATHTVQRIKHIDRHWWIAWVYIEAMERRHLLLITMFYRKQNTYIPLWNLLETLLIIPDAKNNLNLPENHWITLKCLKTHLKHHLRAHQ